MNTEFKDINKRYDLFWSVMKYEKENNVQQAIETYLLYSEALAFATDIFLTFVFQLFMINLICHLKLFITLNSMSKDI